MRAGSQGAARTGTRIGAAAVLLAGLLWMLVAGAAAASGDYGFRVTRVETRLDDGTFYLDADIDYVFSPEALEALENGVPLTLSVRIHVRGTDAWIWEDSVVDARLRYAIRYKPLSERYEVYRLPGNKGHSFVTRDAAITALGEIRDLQLVGADRLEPGADYEVQIKVELDVEELPLPLRPMAYLTPAWKLSSSWSKWPLKP